MQVGELTAVIRLDDAAFLASIEGAKRAFTGLSASASASGSEVGRNFSGGIAAGITGGTALIQSAARAAARAAKTAAQAELQVHSPSRVGIEIGANFGKGMALGIDEMARSVADAARAMAKSAAQNAAYERGFDAAPQAYAAPAAMQVERPDPHRERPTVLMLNGRELARATAEDNNQALGGRSRQLSLGYGG